MKKDAFNSWKYLFLGLFIIFSLITIAFITDLENYKSSVFGCGVMALAFLGGFVLLDKHIKNTDPKDDEQMDFNQFEEVKKSVEEIKEPKEDKKSLEYLRAHCLDDARSYSNYFSDSRVMDRQREVADWLHVEQNKIPRMLMKRNFEAAMNRIDELMEATDPLCDANARHWYLISALKDFYALRDEDPLIYMYCLTICDYDLSNLHNWIITTETRKEFPEDEQGRTLWDEPGRLVFCPLSVTHLETAIKKAIILERIGDLDAAIEFCEWAIENEVPDAGGKSFLGRKARLEKKRDAAAKRGAV
jgi:hypothetical protein